MVICLERGVDLHMARLMPQPLTVSCFSKIQIGFSYLVPAHPGSPGKGPLNGCVCLGFLCLFDVWCILVLLYKFCNRWCKDVVMICATDATEECGDAWLFECDRTSHSPRGDETRCGGRGRHGCRYRSVVRGGNTDWTYKRLHSAQL